jgi:hypothetical protein
LTPVSEQQHTATQRDEQAQHRNNQHRHLDLSVGHGAEDATRAEVGRGRQQWARANDPCGD